MNEEITLEKEENMTQETMQPGKKQIKAHFSKLGSMMFCGTLIIIIAQTLCQAVAAVINPNLTDNYDALLATQMLPLYIIGFPLMFLLVTRVKGDSVVQHDMTGKQLFIAFTMTYALMILGNLLGLGVTSVIGLLKGGQVVNPLLNIATTGNIWINAIYTVLLAPVYEEFLFRKLVIDRTVRYGEGTAIVLSGMMFALFHGNLNQFVYALPMGLFFAFIYAKTGKIKYTIILHMAVNFMGTVVGLLPAAIFEEGSMAQTIASTAFSVLVVVLVVIGVIFFIKSRKTFRVNAGEVVLEKGSRFNTVILNLGMILYCGFWLLNIIFMLFV